MMEDMFDADADDTPEEESVAMFEVKCDGGCGRVIGFSDQDRKHDMAARMALFIICQRCMNHPEEIAARMAR